MFTESLANGEIYFEDFGSGLPLMFISGLGGIGRFWDRQVETFSSRYRIVLHDHRGTGDSAKSLIRYSISQMAEDALTVMDAAGLSSAVLIGHSTGGAIAQYIAARYPSRVMALVLSATWAWPDDYFRALFSLRKEILATGGFAPYDRLGKLLCHPAWFLASNIDMLKVPSAELEKEIILSRIDAILASDSRPYAKKIVAPTMIIGADDDAITPPHLGDGLVQLLPFAKRIKLKAGGHFCPRTVPRKYNTALATFLETVSTTTPYSPSSEEIIP